MKQKYHYYSNLEFNMPLQSENNDQSANHVWDSLMYYFM